MPNNVKSTKKQEKNLFKSILWGILLIQLGIQIALIWSFINEPSRLYECSFEYLPIQTAYLKMIAVNLGTMIIPSGLLLTIKNKRGVR